MFSPNSPFNTRIPAGVKYRKNSAELVNACVLAPPARVFANTDDWGISIVKAKASDPLSKIEVEEWGYGFDYDPGPFRIPADAIPTLGSDHHLAVQYGSYEMDMWVASYQGPGLWAAGSRRKISLVGTGVVPANTPIGCTAANFALSAGVIRPEEIAQGYIPHALVFTTPNTRDHFVKPATHGDGQHAGMDAMPLGARIRLSPSLMISSLDIPEWQRTVARALQDFGAYCVDTGGVFALRGEASCGRHSGDIWSYVGVSPDGPSFSNRFPWDQLKVVNW